MNELKSVFLNTLGPALAHFFLELNYNIIFCFKRNNATLGTVSSKLTYLETGKIISHRPHFHNVSILKTEMPWILLELKVAEARTNM